MVKSFYTQLLLMFCWYSNCKIILFLRFFVGAVIAVGRMLGTRDQVTIRQKYFRWHWCCNFPNLSVKIWSEIFELRVANLKGTIALKSFIGTPYICNLVQLIILALNSITSEDTIFKYYHQMYEMNCSHSKFTSINKVVRAALDPTF